MLELENSNDESGDSSGESYDDFEGYLDENIGEDESSSDDDLSDDEEEYSSDEMDFFHSNIHPLHQSNKRSLDR